MQPALATKGAIPKTLNTNPNQSIYGGVGGVLSTPNTSRTTGMGLSVGNNAGMFPKDTTMKGVSTPPVVTLDGKSQVAKGSPSVIKQQQALNAANIKTPGYVAIAEDGFYGDKTKAAFQQYGFNTQTGQPNTPKTSTTTSSTPAVKPPTDYSSSNPATFSGLINQGANASTNAANAGAENYNTANTGLINSLGQNQVLSDRAQEITRTAGQTMSDIGRKGAMGQAGYRTTGTSPVGEGNSAVLGQTTAAQQQAVAQGANMELQGTQQGLTAQGQTQSGFNQAGSMGLQGQGQGISGLGNIAGQVSPQLGNIGSQQYYNPLNTNQSGGQGGTAMSQLPQQAQTTVNTYAQQVKAGTMTRSDAESRLSAYGITGTNALTEALGQGFNTNASNASAGTTAQGQQIQTAASATNSALDTLTELFNNLSPTQTKGIPLTNSISNWIAGSLGSQALSKYKTNLADARSQLIGVLNSSGGTPTGNENTAYEYLPENMTKAQFDANVGTQQNPGIVRQLVAQKVASFTGSGSQNQTSGSQTGGSIWNF